MIQSVAIELRTTDARRAVAFSNTGQIDQILVKWIKFLSNTGTFASGTLLGPPRLALALTSGNWPLLSLLTEYDTVVHSVHTK
jgi:hypothetical protein